MKTRFTTDLRNPALMRLLKHEAAETDSSMTDVLIRALEAYFAHRLETRAWAKAADTVFADWDNPLDAAYDRL